MEKYSDTDEQLRTNISAEENEQNGGGDEKSSAISNCTSRTDLDTKGSLS